MQKEVHGMSEARELFPAALEKHLQRVITSLHLYDDVAQYLNTGFVPAHIRDSQSFLRTIVISPGQQRYGLYDGALYKVQYDRSSGEAKKGLPLFRTLRQVRIDMKYTCFSHVGFAQSSCQFWSFPSFFGPAIIIA